MTAAERVREALAMYAMQYGPDSTAIGQVTAVDAGALTCTVDDGNGLPWYDVRLMPLLQDQESLVLIPRVGSMCLLARVEGSDDWWLAWAAELAEWRLKAGLTELKANDDGLMVRKGADGLREILTDLVTEILAIYAPKNVANILAVKARLEELLNSI